MKNRIGVRLTSARRAVLALSAAAALAVPVAAGMLTESQGLQPPPAGQRFEVASIRPCERQPSVPGGRIGGANFTASPGRLSVNCMSVEMLINLAYVRNGEPLLNDDAQARLGSLAADRSERIRGPVWIKSDRFVIEASAQGTPEQRVMTGPMLRSLLEDRFKLTMHRDVEEGVTMYALTVAKGGLKVKPVGPDGGCAPWDRSTTKAPPMDEFIEMVRRGEKAPCGLGIAGGERGPIRTLAINVSTLDGVASHLSSIVDRHVLNKTGIEGKFVLYLEYAEDEHTPRLPGAAPGAAPSSEPGGPTIFAALERRWGLTLEPARGPKGYIVVDRVERPSIDAPTASAASPARASGAGSSRAGGPK